MAIVAKAPLSIVRQTCAVIAQCDLVLGIDSAPVHIAGALEVPCIALYGPFPADLRTKYCPTTFALSGKGKCAPCFHHSNPGRSMSTQFPKGMPCEAVEHCVVLASISPSVIVNKVVKHARKFNLVKE